MGFENNPTVSFGKWHKPTVGFEKMASSLLVVGNDDGHDMDNNDNTHVYRDYSLDPVHDSLGRMKRSKATTLAQDVGKSPPACFPIKLHAMLEEVERQGLGSIVSWQPHGRCFLIRDQAKFTRYIMPMYFCNQSKFSSFQRQLNLYEFCRISSGPDKGGYYHELFLRNKLFLCRRMQRSRVKGTRVRKVPSPESEPNFYKMPPIAVAQSNGSRSTTKCSATTRTKISNVDTPSQRIVSLGDTPPLTSTVPSPVLNEDVFPTLASSSLVGCGGSTASFATLQESQELLTFNIASQHKLLLEASTGRNLQDMDILPSLTRSAASPKLLAGIPTPVHIVGSLMDQEEEEEREFDAILSALSNMPVDRVQS